MDNSHLAIARTQPRSEIGQESARIMRRLDVYRPRFRDRRFWVTQGFVVAIAGGHAIVEAGGYLTHMGIPYFIPVSLFFVPVVYAALNFGFAGSVATALWAVVITVPNGVFWHAGLERLGETFQMAIIVAMAIFVGQRVDRETTARRQAETIGAALQASEAELRAYAAYVLRAQEDERQRMARELHDETIQMLVLLCQQLDSNAASPTPDGLQDARRTAEHAVTGLRNVVKALRPPLLDDLGLVVSLRRLLADFTERTEIAGRLDVVGEYQRLPQDTELALFRIGQEALSNTERHSKATHVSLTLTFTEKAARLDVIDNGIGFIVPPAPDRSSGHLGLLGMQERAELLGGRFEIESSRSTGTRVTASVLALRQTER